MGRREGLLDSLDIGRIECNCSWHLASHRPRGVASRRLRGDGLPRSRPHHASSFGAPLGPLCGWCYHGGLGYLGLKCTEQARWRLQYEILQPMSASQPGMWTLPVSCRGVWTVAHVRTRAHPSIRAKIVAITGEAVLVFAQLILAGGNSEFL